MSLNERNATYSLDHDERVKQKCYTAVFIYQ